MTSPLNVARVHVGLIHVHEPTVEAARAAVVAQRGVRTTISEIADLPQLEAHQSLYAALDAATLENDLLVKVDGDMVIKHPHLFGAVAQLLADHPEVDRIAIGVNDWFSGRAIDGMVFWRGGVRWVGAPDPVRMDHVETTVRDSLRIVNHQLMLVSHGSSPTEQQAIRYGIHRGRKARLSMTRIRISDATEFVRFAGTDPHPRRLLAVAAVEHGLRSPDAAAALMEGSVPTEAARRLAARSFDADLVAATLERLQALEQERRDSEPAPPPTPLFTRLRRTTTAAARVRLARVRAWRIDPATTSTTSGGMRTDGESVEEEFRAVLRERSIRD